jgi:methyl-accepting chemotaxis protein
MKNIPIIGKFGAILTVFGVFSITVALYSTTQMRTLNEGNLAMRAGPTDALLGLIRSNIDIQYMRENATVAMTSKNPAAVDNALAAVKRDSARFAELMDLSATDDPAEADAIRSVKSQLLHLAAGG